MEDILLGLMDLGLTPEQIKAVKKAMANYALRAVMDSEILKEADAICQEI